MRAASLEASSAEIPAKTLAQKKIAPSVAGLHAEAQIKPVGGEALHHEAAGEGIESEEAGKFGDDAAGMWDAEEMRFGGGIFRGCSDFHLR